MTEVAEEQDIEQVEQAEQVEVGQEEGPQENPEESYIEQRAAKMGWVPKDEFRGDASRWRPADKFVERGDMMIPILHKKIRNLEKQQADKDKAFEGYLGDLRTKIHEDKVEAHETRKRQAVEEGDTEAYSRLSMDAPKNELPEYKAPAPTADPAFDDWIAENDWYQSDYEKNQEAENYGRFLRSTNPGLEGRDFLDEVSKHVRKKFENPNRQKASAVDGGTPKGKPPSGKLYERLPEEAKQQFNAFVRDGIFKNTAEHREAYAKDVVE